MSSDADAERVAELNELAWQWLSPDARVYFEDWHGEFTDLLVVQYSEAIEGEVERVALRHIKPGEVSRAIDALKALLMVLASEVSLRTIERASLPRTREAEVVICSAIRLSDGRIFRGHRHHDCIRAAHERVEHQDPGSWEAKYRQHDQGFITSKNRYVDRAEAFRLQQAAGIQSVARDGYRNGKLFSEDLY